MAYGTRKTDGSYPPPIVVAGLFSIGSHGPGLLRCDNPTALGSYVVDCAGGAHSAFPELNALMIGHYLYVRHLRDVKCSVCDESMVPEYEHSSPVRMSHVMHHDGTPYFIRGDNRWPAVLTVSANCSKGHPVYFKYPDDIAMTTETWPPGSEGTSPVYVAEAMLP